jgi:magnesium transporter
MEAIEQPAFATGFGDMVRKRAGRLAALFLGETLTTSVMSRPAGEMDRALPFLLRGLGADPASASAPFVTTLVDLTGLGIYVTVAMMLLRGTPGAAAARRVAPSGADGDDHAVPPHRRA